MRSTNFIGCCISILGSFCLWQYFWCSLYMVLMVLTFIWSLSLIVNKILPGFTMFLVNWLTIKFCALLKWPTYEWPNYVAITLWLWKSHSTVSLQHVVLTNLFFNLKWNPYFMILVDLRTNLSLYCLYFYPPSPFYNPISYFFTYDFWITTTNLCSFFTGWAQFNKLSCSWKS